MAIHYEKSLALQSAAESPLLTLSGVRKLVEDYESDVRLLAELPTRIERKKRLVEAAMLFLPAGVNLSSAASSTPADDSSTDYGPEEGEADLGVTPVIHNFQDGWSWVDLVLHLVEGKSAGVSHREMRRQILSSNFAEKYRASDKGFYNAISRLSDAGKIVKAGGLMYAREIAEGIIQSSGELPDMSVEAKLRPNSTGALAIAALKSYPDGLTANELREQLAKSPEAPKSIAEHGHYIYNILATLIGSGAVAKKDGKYVLA